jgi:hypothetical protein
MINGKKVIMGTVMTNVVENKYWPVSEHSLLSFSNTDFIDEVVVVDGMSTDDTVEKHSKISQKIKFLTGPVWDTSDLSQTNFIKQCNVLYKYCNNLKEDVILIFECADVLFPDEFRSECKSVIHKIIDEKYDYCILPYSKMLTPWLRLQYSYKQKNQDFYNICITYFQKNDNPWKHGIIHDGCVNAPFRSLKKLIYDWKSSVFSYETWFFDKDQFTKKIMSHYNWDSTLTIDQTIDRMYNWKIKSMPNVKMKLSDHPKEANSFLKILKEDHQGFSLFGHVLTPMSYSSYQEEIQLLS